MYCEYLYVILNYFSTLTKKEKRFEVLIPFLISIASLIVELFSSRNIQFEFINGIISFIESLLGFTLAALAILLSNNQMEQRTRNYDTNRKIQGKTVSMYKLIVIYYSYIIIAESLLCVLYYIASLFQGLSGEIFNLIANTVFIMGIFNVLFATIRTVANLYFVTVSGEKQE
jgi:hypothetical protein